MSTITFKRGGTFSYGGLVTLPDGTWGAACTLIDSSGNAHVLVVTLTPPVSPATQYALLMEKDAAATAAWPRGRMKGDIVFTNADSPQVVLPTSSFYVDVVDSETL